MLGRLELLQMRFPLFKRRLRKIFANKQSFWFFLSCLSYYSFFLLPTTQSAHNNSRLCISLVLIDSSRLSTLNTVSALDVNFNVELLLDGVLEPSWKGVLPHWVLELSGVSALPL